MDEQKLEDLLKRFGAAHPEERLFEPEVAAELRERLQSLPSARHGIRRILHWGLPRLAAAAAIVLAVVYFRQGPPAGPTIALVTDVKHDRSELFRGATRAGSGASGQRLYVGLKTDQPVFVRLVGIDEAGRTESLPLRQDGAKSIRVEPGRPHSFGGYEVRSDTPEDQSTDLAGILVAACTQEIPDDAFSRLIAVAPTSQPFSTAQSLEGRIESRFSCVCKWIHEDAGLPVH